MSEFLELEVQKVLSFHVGKGACHQRQAQQLEFDPWDPYAREKQQLFSGFHNYLWNKNTSAPHIKNKNSTTGSW